MMQVALAPKVWPFCTKDFELGASDNSWYYSMKTKQIDAQLIQDTYISPSNPPRRHKVSRLHHNRAVNQLKCVRIRAAELIVTYARRGEIIFLSSLSLDRMRRVFDHYSVFIQSIPDTMNEEHTSTSYIKWYIGLWKTSILKTDINHMSTADATILY